MTESVSRFQSLGISGRGFEPALAVATYEQYPAAADFDDLKHVTGRSPRASSATKPAINWMRQGLANPEFLSFDIEQRLPEQTTAPIALPTVATFTNKPVRYGGKHLHLSTGAETWCEPIELLPPML